MRKKKISLSWCKSIIPCIIGLLHFWNGTATAHGYGCTSHGSIVRKSNSRTRISFASFFDSSAPPQKKRDWLWLSQFRKTEIAGEGEVLSETELVEQEAEDEMKSFSYDYAEQPTWAICHYPISSYEYRKLVFLIHKFIFLLTLSLVLVHLVTKKGGGNSERSICMYDGSIVWNSHWTRFVSKLELDWNRNFFVYVLPDYG